MNIDLVKDALEYYDENTEFYSKFLKKAKYINFIKSENEMDHNMITFYDREKNIIHESAYEVIGTYAIDYKLWTWSWGMPFYEKNSTYISAKILNYGIQLPVSEEFLKTELVNSRFKISTKVQLDIHAAIASYLSKQPFILSYISELKENKDYDGYVPLESTTELDRLPKSSLAHYLFILDDPKES